MILEPLKTDWSISAQEVVSTADLNRLSTNADELYKEDSLRRLSGGDGFYSSTTWTHPICLLAVPVPRGHSVILRTFKATAQVELNTNLGDVDFRLNILNAARDEVLYTEEFLPTSGLTDKAWVYAASLSTVLYSNAGTDTVLVILESECDVNNPGYFTTFIDSLVSVEPTPV